MLVMKRHGVIPRSSSFKLSSIDNAADRSSMTESTSDCSKFLYRNARRTASSSRRARRLFGFRSSAMQLKKYLFSAVILLFAAPLVPAQVVVIDPAQIANNQANHIVDLAKYVEMVNNQLKQITTMTQELQQVTAYVKAFGDPSSLLNVTGANQLISSLRQTGVGQTIGQLQQAANGIQALEYTGNGLYTNLGSTFTTPGGVQLPRVEELYRKYGAVQQSSQNFQGVTTDVLTRRANLRNQIASTTTQLQAATTDAETQKLTGVLVGYNAELATVDHEIDNAAGQVLTQDAENRADKERDDQARREERQAQMEESFRRYGEVFQLETTPPTFPEGR